MTEYDALADVYDWLVPEELLTPEGSAAAFAPALAELPAGARVLDCAAGTGQLAVGLALRGFAVSATDASNGMIARTRALAARVGAAVHAEAVAWEDLPARPWAGTFDAVLCVGNSLVHAAGRDRRRAALAAMAGVLREGGLLLVTSRNWEALRAARPGLEVADALVDRAGGRGLVIRAWTLPEAWDARHTLDVAVAVIATAGEVRTVAERLVFWPFTHEELHDDLRAARLAPASTTYAAGVDRYLVSARRVPVRAD
ncbi:MAG TPA: methyltransferase domain-containing protein [Solirubrobacteraceae bacterium]|nr:methyltransferase domain-containing protein [Solirubrobacteraceae bacterium]